NITLRDSLNPKSSDKKEWKINNQLLREGDKVIQTNNNYDKDVFNGDMGDIKKIIKITKEGENRNAIEVDLGQKKEIVYEREEIKELQLAYAITIHKAEGGESPVVIMPATLTHSMMLTRNLIYTAVTRAREKMVLIGNPQAVEVAVKNNKKISRNSLLTERIQKHIEYN